jgi:hypothetical protein
MRSAMCQGESIAVQADQFYLIHFKHNTPHKCLDYQFHTMEFSHRLQYSLVSAESPDYYSSD